MTCTIFTVLHRESQMAFTCVSPIYIFEWFWGYAALCLFIVCKKDVWKPLIQQCIICCAMQRPTYSGLDKTPRRRVYFKSISIYLFFQVLYVKVIYVAQWLRYKSLQYYKKSFMTHCFCFWGSLVFFVLRRFSEAKGLRSCAAVFFWNERLNTYSTKGMCICLFWRNNVFP
jgi:hypothetical protein